MNLKKSFRQLQNDGKTIRLWVRRHDGALAVDATATLARGLP